MSLKNLIKIQSEFEKKWARKGNLMKIMLEYDMILVRI